MIMQKLVTAGVVVAMVLASVPFAQSAEKKEKKKKTTSAPASQTAPTATPSAVPRASEAPVIEAGWTVVKVNAPDLVRVTYKLDGSSILVKFLNLTRDKAVRVKYHAKWKKDWNGRMVDDSTADGLSVRLKKGEEFPLDIRTGAKGVKDIVFTIEASEIS